MGDPVPTPFDALRKQFEAEEGTFTSVGGINVVPTTPKRVVKPKKIKEVVITISCPNKDCSGVLRLVYTRTQINQMKKSLRLPFKRGMELLTTIRPKVYYVDKSQLVKKVLEKATGVTP